MERKETSKNEIDLKIDSLDKDQESKLFEIYAGYFVDDKDSFYFTLREFFKKNELNLPPYIMQLKYSQFILIMQRESLRYHNILKELPLYRNLYQYFLEYEEPLRDIIEFEELFTMFNELHKEYQEIKEIYQNMPPIEKNKCIFVDFMNKVVYFYYYLNEKTRFSKKNHEKFVEYFKSALLIHSDV